jgi:hypothetical protein
MFALEAQERGHGELSLLERPRPCGQAARLPTKARLPLMPAGTLCAPAGRHRMRSSAVNAVWWISRRNTITALRSRIGGRRQARERAPAPLPVRLCPGRGPVYRDCQQWLSLLGQCSAFGDDRRRLYRGTAVFRRAESLGLTDNQRVSAGDVIGRIDDHDYRIAPEQAQAQVAAAQATIQNIDAASSPR